MNEKENKAFELSDEDLKQVSGGDGRTLPCGSCGHFSPKDPNVLSNSKLNCRNYNPVVNMCRYWGDDQIYRER